MTLLQRFLPEFQFSEERVKVLVEQATVERGAGPNR